jgi:hypothetical protein
MLSPIIPPRLMPQTLTLTPLARQSTPLGQIDTTAPWLNDADKKALGDLFTKMLYGNDASLIGESSPSSGATAAPAALPETESESTRSTHWGQAFHSPAEEARRTAEQHAWQQVEQAPNRLVRQQAFQAYLRLTQPEPSSTSTTTPNPGPKSAWQTQTPAQPAGVDNRREVFPAQPTDKESSTYSGATATASVPWHTERPFEAPLPKVMIQQGKFDEQRSPDTQEQLTDKLASYRFQHISKEAAETQVADHRSGSDFFVPDGYKLNQADLARLKAGPKAHTLERHGPSVSDELLQIRAFTGVAPDGFSSKLKAQKGKLFIPELSSKFHNDASLKIALDKVDVGSPAFSKALDAKLAVNPNASQLIVRADTNTNLGYGYKAPSIIGIEKGQTATGPLQKVENLRYVEAKYILNKSTNTWELRTMFPTLRNP